MPPTRPPAALALALLLAAPIPAADAPYADAVARLTRQIEREAAAKRLPAVAVALVDDQRMVWAAGFGHRDAARTVPATADTVFRVGSVSKLFTDVAVMRMVERGKLSLDAPVADVLPDFRPRDPFAGPPITLRHLMAHRSGLMREPPVGSYFDPTAPTLEATVASLNGRDLVYPVGKRIKYSNAAIAVVGRALERASGRPFAELLEADVLAPLGATASAFRPTPAVRANLAEAVVWTEHGREFPAPTFELGMAPAGSLYSTAPDLAKFASCLFAGGAPLLKPESVAEMLKPQFAEPGAKGGFGLGFILGELDGRRRVGHNGAVYGFATELALLPEEKLAAVVIISHDVANGTAARLADDALRLMLAAKAGKPLPELAETTPLEPDLTKELAGVYRSGEKWLEVEELAGRAFVTPGRGGAKAELRATPAGLRLDDVHAWGPDARRDGDRLTVGDATYTRVQDAGPPPAPPERWRGLIGEYGWDHNTLYVLERAGRLCVLIEWAFLYPLTEESADVYAFPDFGLYHGEKVVFSRDKTGRAARAVAAGVAFDRRKVDGENGETFRITPQRPLDELRAAARDAAPPKPPGGLRAPELVDVTAAEGGIRLDVRYATANNFLGTPFYRQPRAFLQRPAADALARAHRSLKADGLGLLVHDAYRPWLVTRQFWDATPEKFRHFVADPAKGSRHNRGCAVDLTLFELATGKPVEMVSGYDEFSDRAYPAYPGGTSRQRWHRDRLRRAMEAEGFAVYEAEWWHFDYKDWRHYPILNVQFEELSSR